ncbi:MAG TPA: AmmeMemoRadiSam system protein B [Chloroflexi bacterium]|nr:AmmeMemoRadiSam system protein B [Chloroflexota bacterium]HHW85880.1 AmmeMemoRadiSam system protein B [Chloroflexota bacterium]
MYPKLRQLDIRPIIHDEHPYILLRDPQRLTDQQLLVPQPLASVMAFFDGQTSIDAMVAAFRQRYRMALPAAAVSELVEALDAAMLLENERAAARRAEVLHDYRAAPYRPPALAGAGYPADAQGLWSLLQEYLENCDTAADDDIDWSQPVGLLSPHIDYARGGAVYAHVWKRAAQVAREAELVILLGTDHYGADLFTLTRQNFATPYGILPTDASLVEQLAAVIGEEAAYAGELRHRGEHSLELVAVWLHHMRAGQPVPIVPILTGSFHPFMFNGATPASDPMVAAVLAVLRAAMVGRRVLVVASGDLAHVGPAFGGAPLDGVARRVLRQADAALIAAMRAGDAGQFFGAIQQAQNANNVCGVAPIYLTLQLLGKCQGAQAGYAICPADAQNTSVVSVTGMVFKGNAGT